jgi:hypothetical protein
MAQVRFAATIAAVTIAVTVMAVSGCSLRSTGGNVGNVGNMESVEAVEVAASAKSGRYMSLFASAMDAIGWVVPLPFSTQGEAEQDSPEVRFSDIAVERVEVPPKYRL